MKAKQNVKPKRFEPQPRTLEERATDAYNRCQFVLKLFQEHAATRARNLATMHLENAASHLELLTQHPFFEPGTDKLKVFRQDAFNQAFGEALVKRLREMGFWSRKPRRAS